MDLICFGRRSRRQRSKVKFLLRLIVISLGILLLYLYLRIKYAFYFHNAIAGIKDALNPWRFSFEMGAADENTISSSQCHIPVLNPFRDDVAFLKKLPRIKCSGKRYGTKTNDGRILIHAPGFQSGFVEYIRRSGDFEQTYSEREHITPQSKSGFINHYFQPKEDYFRLTLRNGKTSHEEFHAVIVKKELSRKIPKHPNNGLGLNVALVMFDSQSNANIQRMVPKVYQFLKTKKDTVILDGHTIVGDGTTAQMCAILTGLNEQHLPDTRRGSPGALTTDVWPFIFKEFQNKGYVTMYSDDQSNYGTFSYRLNGFKEKPTDHYTRPYLRIVENNRAFQKDCNGGTPVFKEMLDYTTGMFDVYKDRPKFLLIQTSAICHNTLEGISQAEDDIYDFLQRWEKNNYYNNTLFIFFGDHGNRVSSIRATINGKLEDRLPFMSITLPPWFRKQHSELFNNLVENSKSLTAHFDIHATLSHILSYPIIPQEKFGKSLFSRFDGKHRSCAEAGVADHWCPCLELKPVSLDDKVVPQLAKVAVNYVNSFIQDNKDGKRLCASLSLDAVHRVSQKIPNWKVRKFSHSRANKRCDSCVLVFNKDEDQDSTETYEVVFSVKPSNGTFEMMLTNHEGKISPLPNVNRVNKYGNHPHCIEANWPNLRPYCFCTV